MNNTNILTIYDIKKKVEEYYELNPNNSKYPWTPQLTREYKKLWESLDIHKHQKNIKPLVVMTDVHMYDIYERDDIYEMSIQLISASPIHRVTDSHWVRGIIYRSPLEERNEIVYPIQLWGNRSSDGEKITLRKEYSIEQFKDRRVFMDSVIHFMCIELMRDLMDVEALLESYKVSEEFMVNLVGHP